MMKKEIAKNPSEQAEQESMLQNCNALISEGDTHGSKQHNRESTRRSSKKLTGSLAAKLVAICLVIVSAVMCVASAAAVIMADYMNVYSEDETAVLAHWNERLLDRYSVYALVNGINQNGELIEDTKVLEELDRMIFLRWI